MAGIWLKKGCLLTVWFFSLVLLLPAAAGAEDLDALKEKLQEMSEMMQTLQQKIETLESANEENTDEIEYMGDRLDKAELHTATDKLSLGFELRTRADSLHYDDILVAPDAVVKGFFTPVAQGGFNGATLAQIQQGMAQAAAAGMVPNPVAYDADNDVIYSNRFRLEMASKINPHLSFAGRIAAYKVYGDSSGVQFNRGNLGDITLDGNTSSLPHGDTLHLERAYFNLKQDIGRVPVNLSIGRRPSTEGPPLDLRNYSLEGGSPLASLINWQFDGASLTFGLADVTGIPGAAFKICYGVGFEGDWGNSYTLSRSLPDVDDVHMLGFIATLFDNDLTEVELNYAHASDITDGFVGLTVMPYVVSREDRNGDGVPEYYFTQNSGGFISRVEPQTNIGDWDGASLMIRHNMIESLGDIDLFLIGSWSHTDAEKVSEIPFYQLMGQGLLSSGGDLESRDGYSVYAGARFPMPYNAKLGLEYNFGSKYWLNFTGAEDSLVASKLAARGHVFEAYYIQPVYGRNFFVKLGGQYYDYQYTGSGNPLGEPVDIDDLTAFDAVNAVVDDVWVGYLSAYVRF